MKYAQNALIHEDNMVALACVTVLRLCECKSSGFGETTNVVKMTYFTQFPLIQRKNSVKNNEILSNSAKPIDLGFLLF